MTGLDVDQLRKLGSEATAGPWRAEDDGSEGFYGENQFDVHQDSEHGYPVAQGGCVEDGGPQVGACDRTDAAFIVAARNNWDALVGAVEAVQRVRQLAEAAKASVPNAPYTGLSWRAVLAALEGKQ